jgi:hypothetical protein
MQSPLRSTVRAAVTAPQFWLPVVVLLIGISVRAVVRWRLRHPQADSGGSPFTRWASIAG